MAAMELDFVDWVQARTAARGHPSVRLGVGDDMAILDVAGSNLLLSSDMLLDGVHFDTGSQALSLIGRKALACCLSDCAAMAVKPVAATISIAWPDNFSLDQGKQLFEGAEELAAEFDLAIVGGDTTRWAHPLAIDVAMTATPYAGVIPVTRSGAQPGDGVYVTGMLGGSSLGHHLSFTPRVNEARSIATALGHRLHAMLDISDGLSLDLWRMTRASKIGAKLDEGALEEIISDDAKRMAGSDGRSPLDHALHDGEDFELLMAISGDVTDLNDKLYRVGEIVETGYTLARRDGTERPLEPKGYVH